MLVLAAWLGLSAGACDLVGAQRVVPRHGVRTGLVSRGSARRLV